MISLAFSLRLDEPSSPANLFETEIVRVRTLLNVAYLFLEQTSVNIQKQQKIFAQIDNCTYLTRFSEAMTLEDMALPRACSSMVSWISR